MYLWRRFVRLVNLWYVRWSLLSTRCISRSCTHPSVNCTWACCSDRKLLNFMSVCTHSKNRMIINMHINMLRWDSWLHLTSKCFPGYVGDAVFFKCVWYFCHAILKPVLQPHPRITCSLSQNCRWKLFLELGLIELHFKEVQFHNLCIFSKFTILSCVEKNTDLKITWSNIYI